MNTALTLSAKPSLLVSHPLRQLLFFFVWCTFFLNAIVIKEPAPCDLFMMGFALLMPLFGLVRITPLHGLYFVLWMVITATGLIAAGTHELYVISLKHIIISAYLAMFSIVLASFVSKDPFKHYKIIWHGYICGAVIASIAGIAGYFDLFPGAFELFTKYSRASGTFKDPNVFGPYLVPAFLYCLHQLLSQKLSKGLIPICLMGLFLFCIFMSFSRGAWMVLVVSSALYILTFFVRAESNRARFRTTVLCLSSLIALVVIIAAALQSPKIQDLWEQRAAFVHEYDVGNEGRFSGHKKAMNIILENPIGIGALYFGYAYHHELPHNVYLSMYLTSGWIGGTLFLGLMVLTLVLGGTLLFKRTPYMHYYAISYCTFVGLFILSYFIDSDHWRLLYIIMGLVWGGYAAHQYEEQNAK